MSTRVMRPFGLVLLMVLTWAVQAPAPVQASEPENEIWFDPQKYTVGQFLKDGEAGDHEAQGMALLWAFGFQAGRDESKVKTVDDHAVRGLMYSLLALGEEQPQLKFMEAVKQAMSLEAQIKKPQPAQPAAEPEAKR